MDSPNYNNPDNSQSTALAAVTVTKISPPLTGKRIGLRGSNPTQTSLYIVLVLAGSAPPSAASVVYGQWAYSVPAGSSWQDAGGNVDAYAYSTAGGTVYCEELV